MMERLVIDLLSRFHIQRDRAIFEVFAAYEDELERNEVSLEAATPRESR